MVLYLERKDQQVKINIQRLIEAALGAYHRAATITVLLPGLDQTRVVVYLGFESVPGTRPESSVIRAQEAAARLQRYAGQTLPICRVPWAFILICKPPVTVYGKIDRTEHKRIFLDEHLSQQVEREKGNALASMPEPLSATEARVSRAIAKFFVIPQITSDKDLFRAGILDSLSFMSLAAHLRRVLRKPVLLQGIRESRTIRRLSLRELSLPGELTMTTL